MRAAVLREGRIAVEERARPMPGPGQVLLKTRLCGICGSDLHLAKHGAEIAALGAEMGAPAEDLSNGLVLGHEFVGEVAELGPETVGTHAVGSRVVSMPFLMDGAVPRAIGASVAGLGAYAEYFLGSEALLLPVPNHVPDEAAALVEPLAIAVHAVARAGLAGHACAILGCGPIGLAVAAVLKAEGVTTIVAADLSAARRDLATKMGATTVVDPRETPVFATLAQAAPGAPAMVFDCTGAKGVLARTIKDAPQNATIVVAGIAPGEETIHPMIAIAKEITLRFVVYYTPDEFARALGMIAEGKLDWRPLVTATIGLDAVPDAFAALSTADKHAKILIDPWAGGPLPA